MYVKGRFVTVPDTASSYVRLVRKNQGGGNGIDGNACTFVMVADGGNDIRNVFGRHTEVA